jgi:hypothetical protein
MKEKIETFILQNWLKIVISIGVIIVGYYFVIYLPKEDRMQNNLANQIKCQQEGIKRFQNDKEEGSRIDFIYSGAEFKFNDKIDTCLYKVEIRLSVGGENIAYIYKIIDIYTNKNIFIWNLSWDEKNQKWTDSESTQKEWEEKYRELFL